jgi:hypothetical protein
VFLKCFLRAGLTCAVLSPAIAVSADAPPPLFGDWWYKMPDGWRAQGREWDATKCGPVGGFYYDSPSTYVPVNQPGGGHGGPTYESGTWMADYAICVARHMASIGAPVTIMLREGNCPFPYHEPAAMTPDVLETALDVLPRLDYIVMDLEPWGENGEEMVQLNVTEIVEMVRSHPNPDIANAYIGNYDDYPGASDEAKIWPGKRNRKTYQGFGSDGWDRELLYQTYLNIAMPSAYPYEVYSRHSDAAIQGEDATTPNDRAAIFWAPLERVSNAARELPRGHLLIPWLSNFVDSNASPAFYNAPPPSEEDMAALVQHTRLRGAHSFMIWTSDKGRTDHPTVDYQSYRALALEAWSMLDPVFDAGGAVEYLNLKTAKTTGLNWSGIRAGNDVLVLVSNLDETKAQSARLPEIDGLPSTAGPVGPGEHAWFSFTIDSAARDFDGDGDLDTGDFVGFISDFLGGGEGRQSAGGKGTGATDINTDGMLDLRDVLAVVTAYRGGKYQSSVNRRSRQAGKSAASERSRTASVETR